MSAVLDFPPLADPPSPDAPTRAALVVLSIREATLARFSATETDLRALAEKYRAVVFDVSTPKGLASAKAARLELREAGRYVVQRVEKAVKDEVNDLKRVVTAEAERLIAIVKPTEDAIDQQIVAREFEIAEEKAAAAAAEAERKAGHERGLSVIRGYVQQAAGRSAPVLALAIDALKAMVFGEAWQEYAERAGAVRDETVAALQRMHDAAVLAEQVEAQRVENERIAAEQAERQRLLDAQAAELARLAAEEARKRELDEKMDAAYSRAVARCGEAIVSAARDRFCAGTRLHWTEGTVGSDYIAMLDALHYKRPPLVRRIAPSASF